MRPAFSKPGSGLNRDAIINFCHSKGTDHFGDLRAAWQAAPSDER